MSIVCGFLGRDPMVKQVFEWWNTHTTEAVLVKYPTTAQTLPVRLSEMFLHDRSLYFIAAALQKDVLPLLDSTTGKLPNIVFNRNGVLHGEEVPLTEQGVKELIKRVDS